MLSLANDSLRVDLLDPVADISRLGPRFCSGGFIWQVHDHVAGPLLSGPEGVEPNPEPFNGHGLPESFRDRSRAGQKWLWQGDEGIAPGVGKLGRVDETIAVVEPCFWHIDAQSTRVEFRTRHQAAGYACEVTRIVELDGRVLRSQSRLLNLSDQPMHFEWFAHPFFALGENASLRVELPRNASLSPDSGFEFNGGVLTPSREYIGKDDGAFVLLDGVTGTKLECTIGHPRLSDGIKFTTNFVLSECPIWMNGFTFSIEPYQLLDLTPGAHRDWQLTYEFGEPAA
ncbi:MAG: hypothetical protein HOH58_06910 [Opitutaceae bacterium]|jgi:hypothetical protein|nr:hypothetical protein [Opitutaceae bacterium]